MTCTTHGILILGLLDLHEISHALTSCRCRHDLVSRMYMVRIAALAIKEVRLGIMEAPLGTVRLVLGTVTAPTAILHPPGTKPAAQGIGEVVLGVVMVSAPTKRCRRLTSVTASRAVSCTLRPVRHHTATAQTASLILRALPGRQTCSH